MISLKFIPLSFITSHDEIVRQIKNTVVFAYLFQTLNETTLGEYIASTQYGFTASALESGSHRLLRITDIHHSKVNWESVPFCDCKDDEKYLLADNDILIARTGGTTGKSFFVNDPPPNAVFASYLIRVRLKSDVNIDFINAFLNSYCFWSQIVEMKGGSAQPNVNAEKLKTLVIPHCDEETQARVVRLLKDEDNTEFAGVRERINSVENLFWNNNQISTELSQQLELVGKLRQAFLREAMQGKLVPQDPNDEPASVLLKKIKAEKENPTVSTAGGSDRAEGKNPHASKGARIKKQKPLPEIKPEEIPFEIPTNWIWCRLGNLTETITKGSSPKWQGINYVEDSNNGIFFVTSKNVGSYKLTLSAKQYVEKRFNEIEPRSILQKGDLLTNIVGASIGRTALYDLDEVANINQAVCLIRLGHDSVDRSFLLNYFNSELGTNQMFEHQFAPGRANLSMGDLANFFVPLPPLAEQKRIVEKLEKLMAYCDELEANIRESKQNAETLLQVALKEALEQK